MLLEPQALWSICFFGLELLRFTKHHRRDLLLLLTIRYKYRFSTGFDTRQYYWAVHPEVNEVNLRYVSK